MKRSNRLILLLGVFLAVVAFVGIVVAFGKTTTTGGPQASPLTVDVVVATKDIKLGDVITSDEVGTKPISVDARPADAFLDTGLVIGKTARTNVKADSILTASGTFPAGGSIALNVTPDKGLRAIAIQVDQVTGVGTIIQAGDRVDVILGVKIQEMQPDPKSPGDIKEVPGGPQLSIKTIIQNVKVVGTLLPPPTATTQNGQQPQASPGASPTTTLNGQQEIVLVEVTANQAEVIRYAQLGAEPITLTLRAPTDASAPPDTTDGIVLKTLIDKYGVIPPLPFIATGPLR